MTGCCFQSCCFFIGWALTGWCQSLYRLILWFEALGPWPGQMRSHLTTQRAQSTSHAWPEQPCKGSEGGVWWRRWQDDLVGGFKSWTYKDGMVTYWFVRTYTTGLVFPTAFTNAYVKSMFQRFWINMLLHRPCGRVDRLGALTWLDHQASTQNLPNLLKGRKSSMQLTAQSQHRVF